MDEFDKDDIVSINETIKLPKGVDTQKDAEVYLKNLFTDILKGDQKDEPT